MERNRALNILGHVEGSDDVILRAQYLIMMNEEIPTPLSRIQSSKTFPIHATDRVYLRSVPWAFMEQFRDQASLNHGGQSLERLAERGGMTLCEIKYAILFEKVPLGVGCKTDKALAFVTGAVDVWNGLNKTDVEAKS